MNQQTPRPSSHCFFVGPSPQNWMETVRLPALAETLCSPVRTSVPFPCRKWADLEPQIPSPPQSHCSGMKRRDLRQGISCKSQTGVLQPHSSHRIQIFRAALSLASLEIYADTKSDSFPKSCCL